MQGAPIHPAVAVDFTGLAAADGYGASFTTPIALHLGVILGAHQHGHSHEPGVVAVAAALLLLSLGPFAVLGNVATSTTVIAGILLKITFLGKMSRFTTVVRDVSI